MTACVCMRVVRGPVRLLLKQGDQQVLHHQAPAGVLSGCMCCAGGNIWLGPCGLSQGQPSIVSAAVRCMRRSGHVCAHCHCCCVFASTQFMSRPAVKGRLVEACAFSPSSADMDALQPLHACMCAAGVSGRSAQEPGPVWVPCGVMCEGTDLVALLLGTAGGARWLQPVARHVP